mmetsp:Transcript_25197/g.27502  ORF Transcript_25197/g.27502 Transcript_25197/m.27502 type:complete len:296 (-) Transcript_25197:12-899(-)
MSGLPVDLFFTQSIDNDEEYGLGYYEETEEEEFDEDEDTSGLISPRRKSPSRNRDSFDDQSSGKEDGDNSSVSSSSSRRIRFHEFMKVVLIPTKEEYRKANCDLWWKRHDFLSSQKNANAELRLFSMLQNINIHDAKHQLYQPQSEELDAANHTTAVHEMMEEFHDDPYYNLQNNRIFRRSDSEEETEREKQQMLASLKAAADAEAAKAQAAITPPLDPVTAPVCLPPSITIPHPEEPHEPLNFCVPIHDPVPASNNTRVSKYRNTIASAGILAAMGLFSFAAPIIGFYFLSSQR